MFRVSLIDLLYKFLNSLEMLYRKTNLLKNQVVLLASKVHVYVKMKKLNILIWDQPKGNLNSKSIIRVNLDKSIPYVMIRTYKINMLIYTQFLVASELLKSPLTSRINNKY